MSENVDITKINRNFNKYGFVKIKRFLSLKEINSINNDIKSVTQLLKSRKKNISIYILQVMGR